MKEEAKRRAKHTMSLKGALEHKQETLEEAAHEYFKRGQLGFEKAADTETAFIRGAEWQAMKMFSEEDLEIAFNKGYDSAKNSSYKSNGTFQEDLNKCLSQFKKK